MNMVPPPLANPSPDPQPPALVAALPGRGEASAERRLGAAFRALSANDIRLARQLAKFALLAARDGGHDFIEAKSLECIAHCDRVLQQARRSSEASRRAARLYERLGNPVGESSALNLFAHSCMLLGRTDEALEASLLSVQLSQSNSASSEAVFAYNGLGMAYCWSGNHDKASTSLDICIGLAGSCDPPVSAYQPKLNQLFVEAHRLSSLRYQTGELPSLQRMNNLVRQCRRIERSGDDLEFSPGMLPAARLVSTTMKALHCAWSAEFDSADRYVERSLRRLGEAVTWLDACVHWAAGELAWARRDFVGAEAAFEAMRAAATQVEHEKLACHAHLLLSQLYEVQAKSEAAVKELKALRIREQRMQADSVVSRETTAKWQIGARRNERHLEHALQASRQFERWSFEDTLTGIANRRALERALVQSLPIAIATGRPLSVAMIDINRFKAVNDTFTHQVGDRALQAIAAILTKSVRGRDVAARLAGDEFVVLIDDADAATVAELVGRIEQAVDDFDWDAIAPGLKVSVSIGVSQAIEGDTVESLMHRSDKSMYAAKPGWATTV